MTSIRRLGLAGWTASMVVVPVFPRQCQFPPDGENVGGASATAGHAGTAGDAFCTLAVGGRGFGGAAGRTSAGAGLAGEATGGQAGGPGYCGNGVVETGEACDAGASNGTPNACDATCQFACVGSCPIRVNPGAATNGTGRSWAEPMTTLQNAMDLQSQRGGGEVWVLGGSYPALPDGSTRWRIPSHVAVFGGFLGVESSVAQRPPDFVPTVLAGPANGTPSIILEVVAAQGTTLDGFRLTGGEPAFVIDSSSNITFRDITVDGDALDPASSGMLVRSSSVRFERCTLAVPFIHDALHFEGSRVALVGCSVGAPLYDAVSSDDFRLPWLTAANSRVLLEDTDVNITAFLDESSDALVLRSRTNGGRGIGAALSVLGSAAIVESAMGTGIGYAGLNVDGDVLVFNSSFIGLYDPLAHGRYPWAWAISGTGQIDVSTSVFFGGDCLQPANFPCPAVSAGRIDNSLFVFEENTVGMPETDKPGPGELVTEDRIFQPSNCAVMMGDTVGNAGLGLLSGPHPCPDVGDASLLERSRRQLLDYVAATFTGWPFDANLTRYTSAGFWRTETVVTTTCGDADPPDPGRHFACQP